MKDIMIGIDDLNPVKHAKSANNAAKDVVEGAGGVAKSGIADIYGAGSDLIKEGEKFAKDPFGYIEDQLSSLSFDKIAGAVTLGLDDVAKDLARQAGLGPLVDGINAFAEVVGDVVEMMLRFAKCAHWMENPGFWALSSALYAARTQGWVTSKAQRKAFAQKGEIIKAVGANIPILDMLPCAAEVAFTAPSPSQIAGAASTATGGSPGQKAKTALSNSSVGLVVALSPGRNPNMVSIVAKPSEVNVISRSTDKLDVFIVRPDGKASTAAWQPGDKHWRGWWLAASGDAAPGAPISAVTRSSDKLDIFMVGVDGRVLTAAWQPGDKHWRGWWPIGDIQTMPGTQVGAVSRSRDKLDIFVTDKDGLVWTAAWQPGDKHWRGWWPVAGGKSTPGTPVTAVSRSTDMLDIFMIGLDKRVWTAAWQPGTNIGAAGGRSAISKPCPARKWARFPARRISWISSLPIRTDLYGLRPGSRATSIGAAGGRWPEGNPPRARPSPQSVARPTAGYFYGGP
jgi:hypothetical protein